MTNGTAIQVPSGCGTVFFSIMNCFRLTGAGPMHQSHFLLRTMFCTLVCSDPASHPDWLPRSSTGLLRFSPLGGKRLFDVNTAPFFPLWELLNMEQHFHPSKQTNLLKHSAKYYLIRSESVSGDNKNTK